MRDMNKTQSSQTEEIKVTRNTRIEMDGQTFGIMKGACEGARGGEVTRWEICNEETLEVVDVRFSLWAIKESMKRMISMGGKAVA